MERKKHGGPESLKLQDGIPIVGVGKLVSTTASTSRLVHVEWDVNDRVRGEPGEGSGSHGMARSSFLGA